MLKKKLVLLNVNISVLLLILTCGFLFINDNMQDSRKVVTIIVDLNRQEEFFDQLYKFADIHNFSILIDTLLSSDGEFQIYMKREDVIISGVSLLNEYQIGFYDVTTHPPSSDSVFDYLVSEFKLYVNEVPGITFLIIK